MHNSKIIWSVVFKTWEISFDEFQMGGLYGKYAVANFTLGTILPSAWRHRKAKKTCVGKADRKIFQMQTSVKNLENKR